MFIRKHISAKLIWAKVKMERKSMVKLETAMFNDIAGVTHGSPPPKAPDAKRRAPLPRAPLLPAPPADVAKVLSSAPVVEIIECMRGWLEHRAGAPLDPFYTRLQGREGGRWEGTLRNFKLKLREDPRRGLRTRWEMLKEREAWYESIPLAQRKAREEEQEERVGSGGTALPWEHHDPDEEEGGGVDDLDMENEEEYDEGEASEEGEEGLEVEDEEGLGEEEEEEFKGKRAYPKAYSMCPFSATRAQFIHMDQGSARQMFTPLAVKGREIKSTQHLPPGEPSQFTLDTLFVRKVSVCFCALEWAI